MTKENKSFWSKYVHLPIKSNKDEYTYVTDDIYKEFICENEEAYEQDLDNFAAGISFISRAGDKVYHPVSSLSSLKPVLKESLKAEKKSLGISVILLAVYFYLTFGTNGESDFNQLKVFMLIFALMPIARMLQKFIEIRNLDKESEETWFENVQFNHWLRQGSFQIIWVLPAVLVICFAWQMIQGTESAVQQFGLVKPIKDSTSLYRLLSAAFIHGGLAHIYFNASFLYSVSGTFLKLSSFGRMLLVFLISTIIGSLFSMLLYPETTSVGASGGILGVYGFILSIALRNKQIIPFDFTLGLLINIGFIAILGLGAIEIIDNGAHLGGLLGGLGIGMLYSKDRVLKRIEVLHAKDLVVYEKHRAKVKANDTIVAEQSDANG